MSVMRTLIVAVALALMLSACGRVQYAYSQLDWLVPWYVRDYVRLDRDQRALLDQRLALRLEWHCAAHLPEYVRWLQGIERDLEAVPIDTAFLESRIAEALVFWRELAEVLVQDASPLLATLSDRQIRDLFESFAERNEKTRKEFLVGSPRELHERRVARMEKRLQRWFGRLDRDQVAMLEVWSRELQDGTLEWFDNRLVWQQRLGETLEGRAGGQRFERELAALVLAPDMHWTDQYRAMVAGNRERTLGLLLDLHASASERQRQKLRKEISSLSTQFRRLACTKIEPVPAQASSRY